MMNSQASAEQVYAPYYFSVCICNAYIHVHVHKYLLGVESIGSVLTPLACSAHHA